MRRALLWEYTGGKREMQVRSLPASPRVTTYMHRARMERANVVSSHS